MKAQRLNEKLLSVTMNEEEYSLFAKFTTFLQSTKRHLLRIKPYNPELRLTPEQLKKLSDEELTKRLSTVKLSGMKRKDLSDSFGIYPHGGVKATSIENNLRGEFERRFINKNKL